MFDPIDVLRRLPWRSLLIAGGSAVALAMAADLLLGILVSRTPPGGEVLVLWLMQPQVGMIMSILVSAGIGVLALYLLESRFHPGHIGLSTLWGLIFCVMISLLVFWAGGILMGLLQIQLPVRGLGWVGANQLEVVATAIGALWYGRRYWR